MDKPNRQLTKITQIGVVVQDIDKIVEGMRQIFGHEPDIVGHTPPTDGRYYYGSPEPFSCKMAIYKFANIDIELIQPEAGKNIWNDFMDAGQHGLHHIRFSVDNFKETVDDLKERGASISMQGDSMTKGLMFAYLDTEKALDFVVEIFNEYELQRLAKGK
jgi:hypothetical protein